MDKAEKIIKIILIIAGISLIFLILSTFFPSPEEGSMLEIILLIPIIPVIIGAIILFKLRSDITLPFPLRIIGFVIFILWILSFFVENPFR